MTFSLAPLPFEKNALEPYISAETLDYHYGKHHQTYLDNLNKLTAGTEFEHFSLENVIVKTSDKGEHTGIFNNAAQVWNHTFYWNSLKKDGGGQPSHSFLQHLIKDFGSFDEFKEIFKKTGLAQFGSGWTWLVLDKGVLKVVKTANADLPLVHGQHALLTCDVWEHAYYIDYRNRRLDYMDVFLNHLVNWTWAEERYDLASAL